MKENETVVGAIFTISRSLISHYALRSRGVIYASDPYDVFHLSLLSLVEGKMFSPPFVSENFLLAEARKLYYKAIWVP